MVCFGEKKRAEAEERQVAYQFLSQFSANDQILLPMTCSLTTVHSTSLLDRVDEFLPSAGRAYLIGRKSKKADSSVNGGGAGQQVGRNLVPQTRGSK